MPRPAPKPRPVLRLSRVFNAPRARVFRAWTDPEELKKWWGVGEGYTTPIAEVDLRVGGRYRLGMKPPDHDHIFIVTGVFREVLPPEKLVYTWAWEGIAMTDLGGAETLVTVEFRDLGGSTEVVLVHEHLPTRKAREEHSYGWASLLERLAAVVEPAG